MNLEPSLFEYLLRLADNALILGQRQSEWCGHGPVLEQDIALTNIALDQIGQAKVLLAYAGKIEGKGRTEDALAFLRDASEFRNLLLLEHPNEDWGNTIMRQFFFDAFNYSLYQALCHSVDTELAAIAHKAIKEITYHLRFSSEWVIRLGDGTGLSRQKMQAAAGDLWMYTGEMFISDGIDDWAKDTGIGPDLQAIHRQWNAKVREIFEEATLELPESGWMQQGGKQGIHTESLGFILADMQFLQRAYPGLEW
ncbi:MAG: phenylacetate-CoA oxygenase subunit PaaC [Haliscomenobacter sp.]|nr:phenylacetate-CoA oxygenase subunit PaaC [Haliscomenobacter sp.]MBK7477021.1 phenylacetate-CoA oxygenase subunit PaaC [Haliscomenobacter sp.]